MLEIRRLLLVLVLIAIAATGPAAAAAPDSAKVWTSIASGGTVDEVDTGIVNFYFATATVTAIGTLDLRYNVVAVDGLFDPSNGIRLTARFLDNGASAQVKLYLYEYDLYTGAVTTLLTLDSNSYGGSSLYQTQAVGTCTGVPFDFLSNAYYVHATITETATGGTAGLAVIEIGGNLC